MSTILNLSTVSITPIQVVAGILGICVLLYGWSRIGRERELKYSNDYSRVVSGSTTPLERDLVARLRENKKRFAFLYSSQTGTAQRFCTTLAREIKSRSRVPSLLGSVDNYDFGTLDQISEDSVVFFVIATYGEGEPTDNGKEFHDFLVDPSVQFSQGGHELRNLRYAIFGCGNSSYEHFNRAATLIDQRLGELGATRIGEVGLGDDNISLEEDYLVWKDNICAIVERDYKSSDAAAGAQDSDYRVGEISPDTAAQQVFYGELSSGGNNPYAAPVLLSKDLFHPTGDRTCIHTEIDISGSGLSYQAGDHLGVWPCNPDIEVERILAILGLSSEEKRNTITQVESLDPTLSQIPFPTPSTYLAIFRHYLDISSVPSRQLILQLARYAPNETARSRMTTLGSDKNLFRTDIIEPCLRLSEVLMGVADDDLSSTPSSATVTCWKTIPLALMVSMLPRLQPRYYSISSSSKLHPEHVHITSIVVRDPVGSSSFDNRSRWMYGLGTNFILNIKYAIAKEESKLPSPTDLGIFPQPTYNLAGPKGSYFKEGVYRVPIHIRQSTFRLPKSPRIPVIMIGPGTGVAPFRAFVQDRVALALTREVVADLPLAQWAPIHLFYGCRRSNEDFLYKDEWPDYTEKLRGKFKLHCAFSRETKNRVYVQDLLWEQRQEIASLILAHNAFVYICGDAKNMSRAVEEMLRKILGGAKGGTEQVEGSQELKSLKDRRRLLMDVWG